MRLVVLGRAFWGLVIPPHVEGVLEGSCTQLAGEQPTIGVAVHPKMLRTPHHTWDPKVYLGF